MEELGVSSVKELEKVPYAQLAAAYLKVRPTFQAAGENKSYFFQTDYSPRSRIRDYNFMNAAIHSFRCSFIFRFFDSNSYFWP